MIGPIIIVEDNRQQLVNAGAIPVLISLLSSQDADVQYYCTTALSNIAADGMLWNDGATWPYDLRQLRIIGMNRKKLAQTDSRLVQYLIALMETKSLKVQCQAALALRNLASDGKHWKEHELYLSSLSDNPLIEKYQLEIVRCKGLTPLLRLLKSSFLPLILSSVACIRNISIHPANESPIIEEGFVNPLIELLSYDDNEEIQCHAISTLRNLAASSERNRKAIVEAGAVERIRTLIHRVPASVQTEMTAAIAVLALSDELKPQLLSMSILQVLVPLTASTKMEVQRNSAAAIGNLSSKGMIFSHGDGVLLLYHLAQQYTFCHISQGLFAVCRRVDFTSGWLTTFSDTFSWWESKRRASTYWCLDNWAILGRKWWVEWLCMKREKEGILKVAVNRSGAGIKDCKYIWDCRFCHTHCQVARPFTTSSTWRSCRWFGRRHCWPCKTRGQCA